MRSLSQSQSSLPQLIPHTSSTAQGGAGLFLISDFFFFLKVLSFILEKERENACEQREGWRERENPEADFPLSMEPTWGSIPGP